MEKHNGNRLLEHLQSRLVTPMREELSKASGGVARLRLRLLALKVVLVLGICLHVWCGFMDAHSWLWILYILILIAI